MPNNKNLSIKQSEIHYVDNIKEEDILELKKSLTGLTFVKEQKLPTVCGGSFWVPAGIVLILIIQPFTNPFLTKIGELVAEDFYKVLKNWISKFKTKYLSPSENYPYSFHLTFKIGGNYPQIHFKIPCHNIRYPDGSYKPLDDEELSIAIEQINEQAKSFIKLILQCYPLLLSKETLGVEIKYDYRDKKWVLDELHSSFDYILGYKDC